MNRKQKKYWIAAIFVLTILLLIVLYFTKSFFNPAITQNKETPYILYIPSGSNFNYVFKTLVQDNALQNPNDFIRVAKLMRYHKEEVPPGKYVLHNEMTTKQVIGKLRSGDQDPAHVVINNVRTIADLAGKLAGYLEADSLQIMNYVMDLDVQRSYNLNAETMLTLFIPNTYQIFWTTNPDKLLQRMKREHDAYWTQERLDKIKKSGLSPIQAYTLASIVEKESNYFPERAKIAGVYLNRLKRNMKLQADPTVVFALGQYDLKRVLYVHLENDSPYNTYKYEGIPPGPIYMPSLSSLDAVINPEDHNYIFFCAKPDNSGQHAFAETLDEHNKNASRFSEWLNTIGIR